MFEKLICKIFGHKWRRDCEICARCGITKKKLVENTCGSLNPQVIEILSRAPKVSPTASHKPMETPPKFKNELARNKIPELNKKRREATLGYGLKSRNFRPRPAHEKRLCDLRKKPQDTEDD